MVATLAIQSDMLIDDFIYMLYIYIYCYTLPLANPLLLGNGFMYILQELL